MRNTLKVCALLAVVALLLNGCMLRRPEPESVNEISLPEPTEEARNMFLGEQLPPRAANVTLYFAQSDGASFSAITRSIRVDPTENLLEAAVNALLARSLAGAAMPVSNSDVRLLSCEFASGIATVNLSVDARNVQSEQELLSLEVAIGNTLLGINGVRGVNVLIGNQSESFCQLPFGLQTEVIGNITASYAQLQTERDHYLSDGASGISRKAALYFPTEGGSWLVPEIRQITFTGESLAKTLVDALKAGPLENNCGISAIPEGAELLDANPDIRTLSTGELILVLNFSSTLANYLAFSGLEVWELVGSIALTMCSFLPEVDAVRVMVNDEPINICEAGDIILNFPNGLIRRRDFTSWIGTTATLYLANEDGALSPVDRAVSMRSALSPRSLLTELFYASEASEDGLRFPAPPNVSPEDVLGIQMNGATLRLNLSGNFYRQCQMLDSRQERSLVYSIVNTLCQLSAVRSVRFYIEGLAADTLAGGIYLKSALMPNPGIISTPVPLATEAPLATPEP